MRGATRSVAKNTFLLTLGLMSGRLLALFLTRKMTPLLGPDGLGIWVTSIDLSSILLVVANFGLGTLITREITRAGAMTGPILWAALRIRWLLGLLCYGFLLVFVEASDFSDIARQAMLLAGLAIFIESTNMACDAVLQGHEKFQYQSLSQVVSAFVYFGLGWVWLDAGHGVLGVIWANIAGRVVRLAIVAPLMFWRAGPWRFRVAPDERRPDWRWLLKLGLPMFLATTFGIIYNKVDTVMLNRMIGEAAAGIYGLGHRALDVTIIVPNLFATALFPAMTRYGMQTSADAVRLGERSLRFILTAIIPFTLFLCFVAAPIIHWFDKGTEFADSIPIFTIVIWGLPLFAANIIMSRLLLTADLERAFIRIGLVSMLVNVVLNLLLIPRYSYYGASVATIISVGVAFWMHVLSLSGSGFRPPLRRAVLGPVAATILGWLATAAAVRLLVPSWSGGWLGLPLNAGWVPFLAVVGLYVLLYVLSVALLGVIRREDLGLLGQLFHRS